NCDKEFANHWQCLEKHNQEYYPCRSEERIFNKCVFNTLNLEKIIPDSPKGKPQVHLKKNPIYK
ncbi:9236_t:CDS:2, partial [Entrophospora sp. SA101]